MRMLYVYIDLRNDTGKVFYVGKGSRDRVNRAERNNIHWQRVVKKAGGFKRKIFLTTPDNGIALAIEAILIKRYGRDTLCNFTDGGKGALGYKHSVKARYNMSIAKKGNKNALGHKVSDASRAIMSAKKIGHKMSEENKRKLSARMKGNKLTLGYIPTKESRLKMSIAQTKRYKK